MRYWIIPYNRAFYKLDELFEKHDEVVWRNHNRIEIGDVAFMYSSAPVKKTGETVTVKRSRLLQF